MEVSFNNYMERLKLRLSNCSSDRLYNLFERLYQKCSQDFSYFEEKLQQIFSKYYTETKQSFNFLIQKLNDLSPLNTLARGYSVVLDENKNVIKSYKQVKKDDKVSILLNEGKLKAKVDEATQ
jgi:exodeoxyribonuclease VII large subunit